jgi:hypothetical protein
MFESPIFRPGSGTVYRRPLDLRLLEELLDEDRLEPELELELDPDEREREYPEPLELEEEEERDLLGRLYDEPELELLELLFRDLEL